MEAKRKKASLAVASVALVAVLAIAGTFAYLQDSSEDVVNTFETNQVKVELTETTGNKYNIIPGTTENKDPKVTVNATVPSYVYVKVTDSSQDLVTYEIDKGWTKLDGYDNVYYREVEGKADAQVFSILKDDKISYSAALKNSDMLDNDGNLKTEIELTFEASAIQREPFNDPVLAYKMEKPTEVSSVDDLSRAIGDGEAVLLKSDLNTETLTIPKDAEVAIDLNGHTLTLEGASSGVELSSDLFVANGTLKWQGGEKAQTSFALRSGSDLTFDGVEFETNGTINVEAGSDSVSLNIVNSTIKSSDYYCISTNAANNTTGENVSINIENSTLQITGDGPDDNGDNTAVLFNIPGKLNISNSELTADRQTVIVRCGTANIESSSLVCTAKAPSDWHAKYDSINWGSGNEVPVAVLVVGNRSGVNAYPYDASCTLVDSTLKYSDSTERTLIYAAAYNKHTTTVAGAGGMSCTESHDDQSTVTINQ